MTRPTNPDDPRLAEVVDLLLGYPDGLDTKALALKLGTGYWAMRNLTHYLHKAKRIAQVPIGNGLSVWAAPRHATALLRQLKAESKERARERQRQQRAAKRAGGATPRAKMWDQPAINLDTVPDLPTVQRTTTCWAPIRQAPGPTSIFDWASHA